MSGLEIERKFLVKDRSFMQQSYDRHRIKQGYICSDRGRTVRVRVSDERAFLTIKGPSDAAGMTRYEFEHEITPDEAAQLFRLCGPGVIDKTRWLVRSGSHVFEVDEFHGDNEGLIVAEVELASEDEPFKKPDFIGREVTGNRHFYNSYLTKHPFCRWAPDEADKPVA